MVFAKCAPNLRARAAAKKQALKQKLAGAGVHHGVSLRLLLVDKQVDAQGVLPNAALGCVHVVKYDAHSTTLAELIGLVREAHRQNGAPFLSMAIAQHGADAEGQWEWTTDLTVNLKSMHGAIDQLAPVIEVLAGALSKTKAGKAHIDLLACNLATTCKGLVPALEKMYGIDFRASTDETGNDLSGGDWKMETDNDYDVAADYLDAAKLKAYTETMAKGSKADEELKQGRLNYYNAYKKKNGKGKKGKNNASLLEYACVLQGELTCEMEKNMKGKFGKVSGTARAEINAHASCIAEANKDGVNLAAELGAAARIELEMAAELTTSKDFKLEGKLRGAAAVFAWAAAKAHLSTAGLYAEVGAKAGCGFQLEGSSKLTLAGGIITIECKAELDAGAVVGMQAKLGCTEEEMGVFKLQVGAGLQLGAGFEGCVEITFDLTKLSMPSLMQAKREMQNLLHGKATNTQGERVAGDGWIRCVRQVDDANEYSFEDEFDCLCALYIQEEH